MNKALIGFAILLIVGGLYINIGLLALLGIFLLIAGVATSPSSRSRVPVSKSQPPRRITPPSTAPLSRVDVSQSAAAQSSPPVAMPLSTVAAPESTGPVYTPPLFPNSMFPSLSIPSTSQASREPPSASMKQPDELLELGVLVAVMKLAFG